MLFEVGDNVVVIKENLDKTLPVDYKEHLDKVFTVKEVTEIYSYPYKCETEGVDMTFSFKEGEIKLVNEEFAKVKRESKVF